jgi:hypothetical protein
MRHVDISGLTAPQRWLARAQRARTAAQADIAAGRSCEFRSLWTDDAVRDLLLQLVGPKCWYCETVIQRADVQVDHYRPKSEVLGDPGHPGYWWLAYDPMNYRVVCKHCNSGGARFNGVPEGRAKGSRFPLLAGPRAATPHDDLALERPVILDPTHPGDPELLGFDSSGCARRRSGAPRSPVELARDLCRADETIRILALNASQLMEQRCALMAEISVLARLPKHDKIEMLIAQKTDPKAQWSAAASSALAIERASTSTTHGTDPSSAMVAPGIQLPGSRGAMADILPYLDPDELALGIPLTGRHGGREHQAQLRKDGRISVAGRAWETATTAARAATGSDHIDGLDFWRLTEGGVTLSLAEFRAAHPPAAAT